jgi:FixJ family two-component response regulator
MSMFEAEVRSNLAVDAIARDSLVRSGAALVSIVDDDPSVRESLPDLLRQFGYAVEAFSSAEEFLGSDVIDQTRCLLLDVTMPGMSGLQAQLELNRRRQMIPIVFITANGDGNLRPLLLQRGAVECLYKPFSEAVLLEAVAAALRAWSVWHEGDT